MSIPDADIPRTPDEMLDVINEKYASLTEILKQYDIKTRKGRQNFINFDGVVKQVTDL